MTIKIISSNILFDSEDNSPHNWANRRELLSKTLIQTEPLIIGTQEGKRPQLKDLESLLPNFRLIEGHRDWINSRMYPSFYVHQSLQVKESGDLWLSETPYLPGSSSYDSMFPRLATWVIITISGLDYLYINCHLDHIRGDTRVAQIQVLIREVQKVNIKCLPLILMGDFNEGPKNLVRTELLSSNLNLTDPWELLENKEETTYHKNLNINPPIGFNGERIDWILHSYEISCMKIQLLKTSYTERYPSDHYPVIATLKT